MRFLYTILVLLLILVSPPILNAQTPLVHYNFNTDGTDAMGNHDATLMPNASITTDPAKGSVAQVTATNGHIEIPKEMPKTHEFTMTTWVKYNNFTNAKQSIFEMYKASNQYMILAPTWGGDSVFKSHYYVGKYKWATSNTKLKTDMWYHVAIKVEKDGATNSIASIYLNGQEVGATSSDAIGGADSVKPEKIYLGFSQHGGNAGSSALFDDFRYYESPLANGDIYDIFFNENPYPITDITIKAANDCTSVPVQGGLQMSADYLPIEAPITTFNWSVINGTGSATINQNALLVGVTEGSIKIVAESTDNSNVSDTLDFNVREKDITLDKALVYDGAYIWYPFDSDGNDAIGNMDLVMTKPKYEFDAERGNVVVFDENDTTSALLSDISGIGEQWSISTWFNWDSQYAFTWHDIFDFFNPEDSSQFYLSPKLGYNYGYGLVANGVKGGGKWIPIYSGFELPKDTWVHCAITYNNGEVVIYKDGEAVAEGLCDNWKTLNLKKLWIGPNRDKLFKPVKGKYDDFVIYNHLLSGLQVVALANDTLAVPPKDTEQIIELENYSFGSWTSGTTGSNTWVSWNGAESKLEANALDAISYGYVDGEGTYIIWALAELSSEIDTAFYISIDNGIYKPSNTIEAGSGWKWVKLFSTSPLKNAEHTIKLAPALKGVKIDRLVVTANWEYDPSTDYAKNDNTKPTKPGNINASDIRYNSALLDWTASTDNVKVIAYDLLNNGKVIGHSPAYVTRPTLLASTNYKLTVRAIDKDGNISDPSNVLDLTTSDLSFTLDLGDKEQTIHHFGASAGFWAQHVGLWPKAKFDSITSLLFSMDVYPDGSPKGIGLSNWRFIIGDGSRDQDNGGHAENAKYRETRSFMKSDGSWDWNSQAGDMKFFDKAVQYGVPHFTAWTNTPPYFMTQSGYSFMTPGVNGYNLLSTKYGDFANYLATIAKHFQDAGTPFGIVSPVNEPQWNWKYKVDSAKQAGTYATNGEIAKVVREINTAFTNMSVDAQIMIPESGNIPVLYDGNANGTGDQIDAFWEPSSAHYIGNQQKVSKLIAGHSYHSNPNVTTSVNHRKNLKNKIDEKNIGLEFWQTEYSLLQEEHYEGREAKDLTPIDHSLWLARLMHIDLVEANATGWDFWTAMVKADVENHKNRFGLLHWQDDETFGISPLYWTFGNFSRFIRPGYTRVNITRGDGLNSIGAATNQLVSAYISDDENELVIVAINYSKDEQNLTVNFDNLPVDKEITEVTPYTSSANRFLKAGDKLPVNQPIFIPGQSVVTLVGKFTPASAIDDYEDTGANHSELAFSISPNPVRDRSLISFKGKLPSGIKIIDLQGKVVLSRDVSTENLVLYTNELDNGVYYISADYGTEQKIQKLIIVK